MTVDVMHIINGLEVGGAERSLSNLLRGGLSGTVRHGVISLQDQGAYGAEITDANVPLWTLGMSRGAASPAAFARLRRIVADASPRLLQGWMYHSNLAAAMTRKISSRPLRLAWNIRQTAGRLDQEKPLTRWVIRAHRPFAAKVDAIVYNCALSQRQHEQLGLRGKHSEVIANGVDTARFCPSRADRLALRRELGISESARVIGHAARYHPMKDHAGLLKALSHVAKAAPDVHFLLAGTGVEATNQDLLRGSAAIGIDRVHLLGERADMPRLLAGMDILCLSSAWGEGFPNVIAEAMACAVPCVATDIGASAEIVGGTGQVVPANAPIELARALITLLDLSADALRQLGSRARQRVLDNYAIDAAVSRYRALYARLLDA
jgi:glycosyltransferase involved in cell wall biosynthesis